MPFQLTPAQLELQAARKAAKMAKAAEIAANGQSSTGQAQKLSPDEVERRNFLRRPWIPSTTSAAPRGERRARIVTWNLLAQTLVRRELFPGSDCLRWSDRKAMLLAEMEYYSNADIICLQECDRLSDLAKALPGHAFVEAKGNGKLHGLVVLYKSARYRVKASKTVYLDEEALHPASTSSSLDGPAEAKRQRGGSRSTKNIGLVVALEDLARDNEGLIVSTAHLFWHPKYAYERVRQSIILLRNVLSFRQAYGNATWPAVISGDFNTQPDEATYQILMSTQSIPLPILKSIDDSRFVHHTIANVASQIAALSGSTDGTGTNTLVEDKDDEGETEEPEPEGGVPGTRMPREDDGIATAGELVQMAKELMADDPCFSAYSAGGSDDTSNTFGSRNGFQRSFDGPVPEGLAGGAEPAYTCYTPLFKLTLDYLLILPNPDVTVTEVLRPATAEELGEGLPRKGICASDHTAVGCEIAW